MPVSPKGAIPPPMTGWYSVTARKGFIMRFAHTTLAFLISTGCVLASTAEARAQAVCNDFTAKYQGNFQLQLGSNTCQPLTGVSVTLAVMQDIIVASSTQGYNGFGIQLNANGPESLKSGPSTPSPQLYWQQFVMMIGSGHWSFRRSAAVA
jgi:hypothetical protein